jgi:hypothetical protein
MAIAATCHPRLRDITVAIGLAFRAAALSVRPHASWKVATGLAKRKPSRPRSATLALESQRIMRDDVARTETAIQFHEK